MKKQSNINLITVFAISAICTFPVIIILWGVRFDNIDDMTFALSNYGFWIDAAEAQGRIKMYVSGPLAMLPYFFNATTSISIFRAVGWLCLVLSLAFYLSILTKNYFSGPVAIGLAALLWSNSVGGHNMLVSYPFYVPVIASIFIFALSAYAKESIASEEPQYIFSSILLFIALSLGGELYFPYAMIFALCAAYSVLVSKNKLMMFRRHMSVVLAIIIPVLVNIIYRINNPSSYEGNSGVNVEPEAFLTTLVTLSGGLLPGVQSFQNFNYIFQDPFQIAFSVTLSFVLFLLLAVSREKLSRGLTRKSVLNYILFVMPLLLFAFFAPNILVSVTRKYQSWVDLGVTNYLYSSFSFLAVIALSVILAIILSKSKITYYVYIAVISVLAALTQANNFYVADYQVAKSEKWDFLDSAIAQIASESSVDTLEIALSNDFYELMPTDDYWDRYANKILNKHYKFTKIFGNGYFIEHLPRVGGNGFLVLGVDEKITHVLSREFCDQIKVCYMLTNKISENGFLESGRKNGVVKVKLLTPKVLNGVYVYKLKSPLSKQSFLGVSQQRYEGGLLSNNISIDFSQGIDGLEMHDSMQWRWARTPAKIDIRSNAQEDVLISLSVYPAASMDLTTNINGEAKIFPITKGNRQELLIHARLAKGVNELNFSSSISPVRLNDQDPRYFSFQITAIDIQAEKVGGE